MTVLYLCLYKKYRNIYLPTKASDTMLRNQQNLPVLSVEGWSGLWLPKMFILVLRFYRENELPLNPH